jgi:hypothetical protein
VNISILRIYILTEFLRERTDDNANRAEAVHKSHGAWNSLCPIFIRHDEAWKIQNSIRDTIINDRHIHAALDFVT